MTRNFLRTQLSFANVTAAIALFIALGGTSYAAVTLQKNSVGAREIRSAAVGTSEVRNGSLTSKDFKRGVLPTAATRNSAGSVSPPASPGTAGAAGTSGATGAQGERGPAGPAGLAGPKGAKGEDGADGATGSQGPAGPTGPAGPQGATGPSDAWFTRGFGEVSLPGGGAKAPVARIENMPAGKYVLHAKYQLTNTSGGTIHTYCVFRPVGKSDLPDDISTHAANNTYSSASSMEIYDSAEPWTLELHCAQNSTVTSGVKIMRIRLVAQKVGALH